jgi:hypothetical protein
MWKCIYNVHEWQITPSKILLSTGQATVIDVDLMIRSMGPVSEIDMVSNEN